MSCQFLKGEDQNKLAKMTTKNILTTSNKLLEKFMWLKVKLKPKLEPELKIKVFWNTCQQRCFLTYNFSDIKHPFCQREIGGINL